MKQLIIGRNSYIGEAFLKSNKSVISTTSSYSEDEFYLDLKDVESFNWNFIDSNTIIYFLSSVSSPDICSKNYEFAYEINVNGTKKFIKKALSLDAKVIFFSSDTVYGESLDVVSESSKVSPLGEYAYMKVLIENEFIGNSNFKVFRLSYVFSKNDKFTKLLNECSNDNKKLEVFEPFDRAIVYIEDLLIAMNNIINLWDNVGSIVNVCGPELVSRKELVKYYNEHSSNPIDFIIVSPEDDFFKKRPKVINVKSDIFPELINNKWTNMKDAMKREIRESYVNSD